MKLTKEEIQVQQLTENVKELESQLISSTAAVKSLKKSSVGTMDMEELLGDNKLVLLIGVYGGATWFSTADCYSPYRDTKKSLRSMNLSHSYATSAALCGDIYVFGGVDGTSWFNTCFAHIVYLNLFPHHALNIQFFTLLGIDCIFICN